MPRKNNVISDRTWSGHQSWNREVIENVSGKRVRMTVKVDAYDFQSWAKAELWNGEKWHTVHMIPGQQVRAVKRVSYVQRTCTPTEFDADIDELRSVTKGVLL